MISFSKAIGVSFFIFGFLNCFIGVAESGEKKSACCGDFDSGH
jgi:hypothetical protein